MTESQLAEIRDYLLERKLPLDILLEVQDHFVSQIQDLINEKNLSFEEAFGRTKLMWRSEFRMTKNPNYGMEDISLMLKKLIMQESKVLLKKSGSLAIFLIALLWLVAIYTNFAVLKIVLGILLSLIFFIPIGCYLLNIRTFLLVRKYNNYKLTFFQDASTLSLILFTFYVQYIAQSNFLSKKIFSVMNFHGEAWLYYALIPILFFIFWLNIYCYFNQKIYLRQIQKIKPFLQYLKPSN